MGFLALFLVACVCRPVPPLVDWLVAATPRSATIVDDVGPDLSSPDEEEDDEDGDGADALAPAPLGQARERRPDARRRARPPRYGGRSPLVVDHSPDVPPPRTHA